jgi:dipeptidyl aminopeptidase/acylaminoacyl peptidase
MNKTVGLWLLLCASARAQPWLHAEVPGEARFSPNGRSLAVVSVRCYPDPGYPRTLLHPAGLQPTMTVDGRRYVGYFHPRWSPDGRSLLAVRTGDGQNGELHIIGKQNRRVRTFRLRTNTEVQAEWLSSGQTVVAGEQLEAGKRRLSRGTVTDLVVSPDRRNFAVLQDGHLDVYDWPSGKRRRSSLSDLCPVGLAWSGRLRCLQRNPWGEPLSRLFGSQASFAEVAFYGRRTAVRKGPDWSDLDSGKPLPGMPVQGYFVGPAGLLDQAGRLVEPGVFQVAFTDSGQSYLITATGRRVVLRGNRPSVAQPILAIGPRAVCTFEHSRWVRRSDRIKPVMVLNRFLANFAWGQTRRYQTDSGEDVLLLPPGHRKGRLPTIFWLSGQSAQPDLATLGFSPHLLARAGYAVYLPGRTGLRDAINRAYATGFVDPDRLATFGIHGSEVLMTAIQPGLRAAVAVLPSSSPLPQGDVQTPILIVGNQTLPGRSIIERFPAGAPLLQAPRLAAFWRATLSWYRRWFAPIQFREQGWDGQHLTKEIHSYELGYYQRQMGTVYRRGSEGVGQAHR